MSTSRSVTAPARVAARRTLTRARAIVACSEDLRQRAIGLGADPSRTESPCPTASTRPAFARTRWRERRAGAHGLPRRRRGRLCDRPLRAEEGIRVSDRGHRLAATRVPTSDWCWLAAATSRRAPRAPQRQDAMDRAFFLAWSRTTRSPAACGRGCHCGLRRCAMTPGTSTDCPTSCWRGLRRARRSSRRRPAGSDGRGRRSDRTRSCPSVTSRGSPARSIACWRIARWPRASETRRAAGRSRKAAGRGWPSGSRAPTIARRPLPASSPPTKVGPPMTGDAPPGRPGLSTQPA